MKRFMIKGAVKLKVWKGMCRKRNGFGKNEVLGIAATLIIAAFIVIPGLRTFAQQIMTAMGDWWTNTVESRVFPTTP